jgi:copper chaperone CopZ
LFFALRTVFRVPTPANHLPNGADLNYAKIEVDGIDCVSCLYQIETSLKNMPGIIAATAGFDKKEKVYLINGAAKAKVIAIYDKNKTNIQEIISKILPYQAKVIDQSPTQETKLQPLSKSFF